MGIKLVTGREWGLNLRHHENGIGNGNELMGMGGNGNVASHSRTFLVGSKQLAQDSRALRAEYCIVGIPRNTAI